MTIDLDEAKDRAERGLLLTARHGEALLAELKRVHTDLAHLRKKLRDEVGDNPGAIDWVGYDSDASALVREDVLQQENREAALALQLARERLTDAEDELALFKEREPLVQGLLAECLTFADGELWEPLTSKAKAVRDFSFSDDARKADSSVIRASGVCVTEIELSDSARKALTVGDAGAALLKSFKVKP